MPHGKGPGHAHSCTLCRLRPALRVDTAEQLEETAATEVTVDEVEVTAAAAAARAVA